MVDDALPNVAHTQAFYPLNYYSPNSREDFFTPIEINKNLISEILSLQGWSCLKFWLCSACENWRTILKLLWIFLGTLWNKWVFIPWKLNHAVKCYPKLENIKAYVTWVVSLFCRWRWLPQLNRQLQLNRESRGPQQPTHKTIFWIFRFKICCLRIFRSLDI